MIYHIISSACTPQHVIDFGLDFGLNLGFDLDSPFAAAVAHVVLSVACTLQLPIAALSIL